VRTGGNQILNEAWNLSWRMDSELISRCSFGFQRIEFTVLVTEISYRRNSAWLWLQEYLTVERQDEF
jgi:hypothetical protein